MASSKGNMTVTKKKLIEKELLDSKTFMPTYKAPSIIKQIFYKSSEPPYREYELKALAKKMRELFPEGKKEGTTMFWRSNTKEVIEALMAFYILCGNEITSEQILKATKEYVDSFKGDTTYMRILKYFIINTASESFSSDLLTYIENQEQ